MASELAVAVREGQPIGQLSSLKRYLEHAADEQHFITRSTDLLATLFNRRGPLLDAPRNLSGACLIWFPRRCPSCQPRHRSAQCWQRARLIEAERAMTHPDILIVGAGVAGLSLATAAGREVSCHGDRRREASAGTHGR